MNSLVTSEVALVTKRSLAAVALVRLVAVHLEHVLLQRLLLRKLGVAFVAEECPVFCCGETDLHLFRAVRFAPHLVEVAPSEL